MIRIYIESGIKQASKHGKKTTNEQNFVEEFIAHHFPDKQKGVDFEVIGIGGKDQLENARLPFDENTLAGGINILLFDADTMENTPERHLKVWEAVLRENIFVLCKTQMAKSITRRTLRGFRQIKVNTRYYEDLINQISHKTAKFVSQMRQGKNYWKANEDNDMKFTAIVGNPPYQQMDGGAGVSAKPIYNVFVDVAKLIRPKAISMIMPAKWYTDGKGLDEFRTRMLNDKHIAKLVDYVDSRDCFSNVDIAGGVCYFLWDVNHNEKCEFVNISRGIRKSAMRDLAAMDDFVRFVESESVIDQVLKQHKCDFYDSRVSSRKPFGLATNATPLGAGDIVLKHNKGFGYYDSSLISKGKEMIPQIIFYIAFYIIGVVLGSIGPIIQILCLKI